LGLFGTFQRGSPKDNILNMQANMVILGLFAVTSRTNLFFVADWIGRKKREERERERERRK
jgi:hypothetical protein